MEKITQEELNKMLELHKLWLNGGINGVRLDLSNKNISKLNMQEANMQEANMQGANMQWANMQGANMQWANMQGADMQGANMQGADMQGANMQGANMQWANMQGADIDFSCWPLWCGSINIITDKKQRKQIGYHLAVLLDDNDPEERAIKEVLKSYVNTFHRVEKNNVIPIK